MHYNNNAVEKFVKKLYKLFNFQETVFIYSFLCIIFAVYKECETADETTIYDRFARGSGSQSFCASQ